MPPRFFTTYEWIIYSHNNLRAAAAYQKAYSKTLCGRQLSSECFTLPSLMASKTAHYGGELIPFLEREEMVGLRMVFTAGSHSFLFFFKFNHSQPQFFHLVIARLNQSLTTLNISFTLRFIPNLWS